MATSHEKLHDKLPCMLVSCSPAALQQQATLLMAFVTTAPASQLQAEGRAAAFSYQLTASVLYH